MALAKWELDVADGTLIPEFRQVHVGYYKERIVTDEVPIETVGSNKIEMLKVHRVECGEPRYEERLVWVRNPDLPKARPAPTTPSPSRPERR